ncbi:hypothetical protein GCM10007242_08740 [Pigmentiphaga litoralis]|nr:hypothetical protein GCM10007242_08740 [Pigmentiphaga litoralis]
MAGGGGQVIGTHADGAAASKSGQIQQLGILSERVRRAIGHGIRQHAMFGIARAQFKAEPRLLQRCPQDDRVHGKACEQRQQGDAAGMRVPEHEAGKGHEQEAFQTG